MQFQTGSGITYFNMATGVENPVRYLGVKGLTAADDVAQALHPVDQRSGASSWKS